MMRYGQPKNLTDRLGDWWLDNWPPTVFGAFIVLLVSVLIASCRANDRLNQSMKGKPRAALVEAFGPPTRTAPSYEGSEVIEWVRHEPGYFMSTYNSDGRGGGYTSMTYIPPRDVIRRAIVRDNRVTNCEGGF